MKSLHPVVFYFHGYFALTRVATCNVSKEQYSPISQNLFTSSSHVVLFLYSFSDCSTSQNFHYFFFHLGDSRHYWSIAYLGVQKQRGSLCQQQYATTGSLSLMLWVHVYIYMCVWFPNEQPISLITKIAMVKIKQITKTPLGNKRWKNFIIFLVTKIINNCLTVISYDNLRVLWFPSSQLLC